MGPSFGNFVFLCWGEEEGEGRGNLSFINLVLKNKGRAASVSSSEKRDAYLRGCTACKENEVELVH